MSVRKELKYTCNHIYHEILTRFCLKDMLERSKLKILLILFPYGYYQHKVTISCFFHTSFILVTLIIIEMTLIENSNKRFSIHVSFFEFSMQKYIIEKLSHS